MSTLLIILFVIWQVSRAVRKGKREAAERDARLAAARLAGAPGATGGAAEAAPEAAPEAFYGAVTETPPEYREMDLPMELPEPNLSASALAAPYSYDTPFPDSSQGIDYRYSSSSVQQYPLRELPDEVTRLLADRDERRERGGSGIQVVGDRLIGDEVVEIESSAAYDRPTDENRRRISFDKESLRTFVLTREILSAPRSRAPHRFKSWSSDRSQ